MVEHARACESFDELYRRFKRGLEVSCVLREYQGKQRIKAAHEVRRDKLRAAARKFCRPCGSRTD